MKHSQRLKTVNSYYLQIFRPLYVSWKDRNNNKRCRTNVEAVFCINSCVIILIVSGSATEIKIISVQKHPKTKRVTAKRAKVSH